MIRSKRQFASKITMPKLSLRLPIKTHSPIPTPSTPPPAIIISKPEKLKSLDPLTLQSTTHEYFMSAYTLPLLKPILKAYQLPTSGKKDELVKRLRNYLGYADSKDWIFEVSHLEYWILKYLYTGRLNHLIMKEEEGRVQLKMEEESVDDMNRIRREVNLFLSKIKSEFVNADSMTLLNDSDKESFLEVYDHTSSTTSSDRHSLSNDFLSSFTDAHIKQYHLAAQQTVYQISHVDEKYLHYAQYQLSSFLPFKYADNSQNSNEERVPFASGLSEFQKYITAVPKGSIERNSLNSATFKDWKEKVLAFGNNNSSSNSSSNSNSKYIFGTLGYIQDSKYPIIVPNLSKNLKMYEWSQQQNKQTYEVYYNPNTNHIFTFKHPEPEFTHLLITGEVIYKRRREIMKSNHFCFPSIERVVNEKEDVDISTIPLLKDSLESLGEKLNSADMSTDKSKRILIARHIYPSSIEFKQQKYYKVQSRKFTYYQHPQFDSLTFKYIKTTPKTEERVSFSKLSYFGQFECLSLKHLIDYYQTSINK